MSNLSARPDPSLRVLLISNLYPSAIQPTRGIFNLNRFAALARFCDVRVMVPVPWWERLGRMRQWVQAPNEERDGVEAIFPTCWAVPRVVPALAARSWARSLRPHVQRLSRDFPFDIIVGAFGYPDAVAAAYLADTFKRPLVSMVLGSDMNLLAKEPALQPQIRWALAASQRVIAVSGDLGWQVAALGIPRERIVVQHNGVNGDQFTIRDRDAARSRLGLPQDRSLVCYIGNLVPEKGADLMIEVMGRLHQAGGAPIELMLIGTGPLEEHMRARSRALGVEGQVRWLGRRTQQEIPDWLTAADVLCLPSRREGCPNVVLEALASGRPVVAARVGGVAELLRDGETGILVGPEDPDAVAAGLRAATTRSWDSGRLRASVPSLSWEPFGRCLHDSLTAAVDEWAGAHRAEVFENVEV